MKTALALILTAVALLYWSSDRLSQPIFDEQLETPPADAFAVAPLKQALTLARTRDGRVLLVTSASGEGVSAVDLNANLPRAYRDAREAFAHLGFGLLENLVRHSHLMVRVPWADLDTPLAAPAQHIAAGTNYSSHAQEVGHEGEPFLFPKLSAATPWDAAVTDGARLDYEVELCATPMQDYRPGESVQLGYLLCNDFTDRWLLVRDIDLDGPMGLTGFALGKGGATRMPVGPLLVIPRDEAFFATLELSLYVDGQLRQRASAGDMIWSPLDVLRRALVDCNTAYDLDGEPVRLVDCDRIAAGTMLLTGTPGGVMFKPATLWAPWAYLRPGQTVQSFGTYLGALSNEIVTP
ncbi:MAG: hypothetical protein Hals2KO_05150 [Halioglobus sp.]